MPEAPPIPDTPSVGLATKLGAAVGALASLLAVLVPVLDGDQTPETLGGLAVAALAFYAVIRGRSDQAAAITVAKGAAVAAGVTARPSPSSPVALYYSTDHADSRDTEAPTVARNPEWPSPVVRDPAWASSMPRAGQHPIAAYPAYPDDAIAERLRETYGVEVARDEEALEDIAREEVADLPSGTDPGAIPLDAGDGEAAENGDATALPQADGPNGDN